MLLFDIFGGCFNIGQIILLTSHLSAKSMPATMRISVSITQSGIVKISSSGIQVNPHCFLLVVFECWIRCHSKIEKQSADLGIFQINLINSDNKNITSCISVKYLLKSIIKRILFEYLISKGASIKRLLFVYSTGLVFNGNIIKFALKMCRI